MKVAEHRISQAALSAAPRLPDENDGLELLRNLRHALTAAGLDPDDYELRQDEHPFRAHVVFSLHYLGVPRDTYRHDPTAEHDRAREALAAVCSRP